MVAGISKLATLPVALPTAPLPANVDAKHVATQFQDFLNRSTRPETFTSDAVWRDSFALTSTFRTFYSAEGVAAAWRSASTKSATPTHDSLVIHANAAKVMALPSGNSWVEVSASFKIRTVAGLSGVCTLMISAVPEPNSSKWVVWAMRTILESIDGWPSVDHYAGPQAAKNGDVAPTSTNGHANGNSNGNVTPHFDVVVVGGGQSGLSTGGRLQALGIDYIIIDSYKQIGDSWASRYDSTRLHTPREYSHLPFDRTFTGDKYQEFLTKDDLAQGYQDWSKKFGVDQHIWTESKLESGVWDDAERRWTLKIKRKELQEQVHSRFVIMATGAGGQVPFMPDLPGRDRFQGIVLHSQQYRSSKAWRGKRGIVVGSANTAHDIADDMYEAGLASTTMVQRSKTYVLPCEYWKTLASRTYNAQIPIETADRLQMTGPLALGRLMAKGGLDAMARKEPERFEALERAGFLTEPFGDIFYSLYQRAGGHYMDVGTSKKIADGKVRTHESLGKRGTLLTFCSRSR